MPFMMISVSKVVAVHLSPKFHVDVLNFYPLRLVYCGFYQHSLNMKFHWFSKLLRQSKKNKCSSKMCDITSDIIVMTTVQEFMLPQNWILLNPWKMMFTNRSIDATNEYINKYILLLCFSFKGIYHDVSEDTHWGEFLNVSINYINKLPKPWDMVSTI